MDLSALRMGDRLGRSLKETRFAGRDQKCPRCHREATAVDVSVTRYRVFMKFWHQPRACLVEFFSVAYWNMRNRR